MSNMSVLPQSLYPHVWSWQMECGSSSAALPGLWAVCFPLKSPCAREPALSLWDCCALSLGPMSSPPGSKSVPAPSDPRVLRRSWWLSRLSRQAEPDWETIMHSFLFFWKKTTITTTTDDGRNKRTGVDPGISTQMMKLEAATSTHRQKQEREQKSEEAETDTFTKGWNYSTILVQCSWVLYV